jgi:hypothetical protein
MADYPNGLSPAVPIDPSLAPQGWLDAQNMTPEQRKARADAILASFMNDQPGVSWLGQNLPWIIGTGGLAASYMAPAAFGMGAGAGAGAAAGGGAGAASMGTQGMYDAGMFAGPSATAGANMAGTLGSGLGGSAAANILKNVAGGGGNKLTDSSSLLNTILGKIAPLGLAGLSAFKGFQTPPAQSQLNDVIGTAKHRVDASEPLFNALNKMAYSQLPDYTKK